MNCKHCGASIDSAASRCPFCGTETPAGAQGRREEEEDRRSREAAAFAHGQAQEQAVRTRAMNDVAASSKTAFVWSLIGFVFCCIPIPAIVGMVLGFRARGVAKKYGVVAPWPSTAAVAIGGCSLLAFGALLVSMHLDSRERDRRSDELSRETQTSAQAAVLDAKTACALTELALLQGYGGVKGDTVKLFRCDGALDVDGSSALLRDVEYSRTSSDPPTRAHVCFSRGQRWKVDSIGEWACGPFHPGSSPSSSALKTATPIAPPRAAPRSSR